MTSKKGFPDADSPPSPAPPPFTLDLIMDDPLMILDDTIKVLRVDIIHQADGLVGWTRVSRLLRNIEKVHQ